MGRVYDAMCESQREAGVSSAVLDVSGFLPGPVVAPGVEGKIFGEEIAWEKVASFPLSSRDEARLAALDGGSSLGAEKFRLLKARMLHLQERQNVKLVVVTSAVPKEGKTLVSANLAISLARHTSQRVLLLEGDLHQPALAERLGLLGRPGISEWFDQDAAIHSFLYKAEDLQLWVLPAGETPEHPLAILQSPRFLDLLQQLSHCFDWILIDAPPLTPLADVNHWSKQSDGLLLVVREGKTPRKILQKGLETLDAARVLGIVFNEVREVEQNYYSKYYGPPEAKKRSRG